MVVMMRGWEWRRCEENGRVNFRLNFGEGDEGLSGARFWW